MPTNLGAVILTFPTRQRPSSITVRLDGGALVSAWSDWLAAGGASAGTIYLYRRYIERLTSTLDPATVSSRQLAAWIADKRWSPATLKSARTSVRSFFVWAQREGVRDDDPAHDLPKVRQPPPCPRPATDDVWSRALDSPGDVRLMVMLAGLAGLRRAEIAGLHSDDLDGDLLRVHGKGGRVRTVPVRPPLLDELQARPEGWVFPGRFPGRHVCPDVVGKRLSAALGPGWSGHKLRHRFATRAYRGSRDLLAVQDLLGHTSAETTRRYVLVGEDALRAAVLAAA